MDPRDTETVTRLIERLQVDEGSGRQTRQNLLKATYDQLYQLARARMRGQPGDHSLQATDLVGELYVRLLRSDQRFEDREHLLCSAARTMRNILVDHARRRQRRQHGQRVPADDLLDEIENDRIDLLALDEVLNRLEVQDANAVRMIELRFFGDQTMQEVARALGRPLRSIERDWQFTRRWLKKELS